MLWLIPALWVANNYRLIRKEKRKTTAKTLLLGPLAGGIGFHK